MPDFAGAIDEQPRDKQPPACQHMRACCLCLKLSGSDAHMPPSKMFLFLLAALRKSCG